MGKSQLSTGQIAWNFDLSLPVPDSKHIHDIGTDISNGMYSCKHGNNWILDLHPMKSLCCHDKLCGWHVLSNELVRVASGKHVRHQRPFKLIEAIWGHSDLPVTVIDYDFFICPWYPLTGGGSTMFIGCVAGLMACPHGTIEGWWWSDGLMSIFHVHSSLDLQ